MKRRWRIAAAIGGVAAMLVLTPLAYIELGCRSPLAPDVLPKPFAGGSPLSAAERRPGPRTFLTYPEWHIVYEADAFGRYLASGAPPSGFAYGRWIGSFWTSYCAVNRATRGSEAAGDAKVTIYTIGISYTVELAVKAAYERTIGRVFEWASGWRSADDRHAAQVQVRYGAFLHETPWYRFPFGDALRGLWRTREPDRTARHWERRAALTAEYAVKAGYAKAIDAATGATVGRDDTTLRFVTTADAATIRAIDPRLKPVRALAGGGLVVEAPRYQQFNALLGKLAVANVPLVEIAGNRTIFATLLLPARAAHAPAIFAMPADRDGWQRIGVAVAVPDVPALLRDTRRTGGVVEHVYDY